MIDDVARYAKEHPLTVRELAWQLLKNTRNPDYVAARYDIPVESLRAALEKIPDEEPLHRRLARNRRIHSAHVRNPETRASEALPPIEREPGSDDDLGE